jgi:archaellum component FlaD/FlaE
MLKKIREDLMAILAKQQEREKIGVNDNAAKIKQASTEHLKQQESSQSQKQLSTTAFKENKSELIDTDDAIKEAPDKSVSTEGDTKFNPIKMAAAMEAGITINEMTAAAPISGLSGAIPSTAVTHANATPLVNLAIPFFGF